MSFWAVMNWVAWGLCAILFILIVLDFVKVEKEQSQKKKSQAGI